MTPPPIPKPLTEKEIDEMDRNISGVGGDFHDQYCKIRSLSKPCDCAYGIAREFLSELKRLRAEQAGEKILMDALIDLRESIDNGHPHGNASPRTWKIIIEKAIEQADAVKDGPSEEDRHRLRIHESMHEKEVTKPHNCEFCWILSELKKAWG